MGEIGKKEGERTKRNRARENEEVLKSAGKPRKGKFAEVELLIGSGTSCVRANILLSVHRSNTVVHQSVVEN